MWAARRRSEGKPLVGVNPNDCRGERRNVEGPMLVADVGAVTPDVRFTYEGGAPPHSVTARE